MDSESLQNLLRHLSEEPDDWSLRARVCDVLVLEGRQGEAIGLLESAPNPPQYEPHVLKAAEVYTRSDPEKAVPLLHDFLQRNPFSPMGHMAMAEVAVKLDQVDTARVYYERAVALNPNYRDPDFERKHDLSPPSNPGAATEHPSGEEPPPSAGDDAEAREPEVELGLDEESEPPDRGSGPPQSSTSSSPEPSSPMPDSAAANASPSPNPPDPARGPAARRRSASDDPDKTTPAAGIPPWVFTTIVALGTFLLCWLVLLVALRAMLLHSVSGT